MRYRSAVAFLALTSLLGSHGVGATQAKVDASEALALDPATGLVMDEHWQIVAAHCGACHSTQLVTQNRGDRETWLNLIRWMQESQGLWPLNEATETLILDYLETHYGPVTTGRRMPLPAALLPPPAKNSD